MRILESCLGRCDADTGKALCLTGSSPRCNNETRINEEESKVQIACVFCFAFAITLQDLLPPTQLSKCEIPNAMTSLQIYHPGYHFHISPLPEPYMKTHSKKLFQIPAHTPSTRRWRKSLDLKSLKTSHKTFRFAVVVVAVAVGAVVPIPVVPVHFPYSHHLRHHFHSHTTLHTHSTD